jgi:hypothetical protein
MRYAFFLLLLGALLTGMSSAQNPAATAPTPAAAAAQAPMAMTFTPGTLLRVSLDKTVDAKKAQVGDQIVAKTMDDLKSVPPGLATKGCQIVGHVVEVTQHQGDAPSTMRIVFDKMVLKNGTSMPLPAFIQAVGYADQFNPATNIEAINRMGGTSAGAGQPQPAGIGSASTVPSDIGAGGGNPAMYGGGRMPVPGATSNPDAKLPMNAVGPIGMSGVELKQGTSQDSIISAKKKNVKLEGGMQMILKTN